MTIKVGEPLSQVKSRMSPDLDEQLVNTLTLARPCDSHGFFKTFVDFKSTKPSKDVEPPLPSYDGSSSAFVRFKRDPNLLDDFVRDCPTISNDTKQFTIDKNKLLSAMSKVEAVHAKKPIKELGYLGGVWNEGDYYMSSDDQLEDATSYEFFKFFVNRQKVCNGTLFDWLIIVEEVVRPQHLGDKPATSIDINYS